MRLTLCALLVLCALFPACDLWGHGGPDDRIPFRTLDAAQRLSVEQAGTAVFNDPVAWQSFWNEYAGRYHASDDSLSQAPAIDFERRTAVGLFWGAQSGCPQAVEAVRRVERAGPRGARVVVGALPHLGDCEAIFYPAQVIVFEKSRIVEFAGRVPQ